MSKTLKVNRIHKDKLFRAIFSDKKAALSLFNAVNGTDYTDENELDIVTLEDAIFMTMKNDLAVCIHNQLSMFEHQSTVSPNMPVRGFIYAAREFEAYLAKNNLETAVYGKKLVKLPRPRYYVLYNGTEETPDIFKYRLSDAFYNSDTSCNKNSLNEVIDFRDYEWTAIYININAGHSTDILDKCPDLKGYSMLIKYIRDNKDAGLTNEDAVSGAIDDCISGDYLKDFLLKHKAEAEGMILTDFDQDAYNKMIREEAIEDYKAKLLFRFIDKGHTVAEAADMFDMPVSEVEALIK